MRAVVLQAGDAAAIATALGFPTPCYNAATGAVEPGVFSLRHRDVEKDDRGRDALVVEGVEAKLPAPVAARVADVTLAVPVAIAPAAVVEELP